MVTTYVSDLYVHTFPHGKTYVTNQNISRWYKHSSQKANLSFEKKFKFLKLFSSRKPEIWLELRCNSGNNKLQSYKVNTFTLYSLWVRFFLPIGHIDQGMTHLRRLCVTVGAASQISYMLTEAICFYNTKYHLESLQDFIKKLQFVLMGCKWCTLHFQT